MYFPPPSTFQKVRRRHGPVSHLYLLARSSSSRTSESVVSSQSCICWWIKTNQWWLESGASGVWDFGIWRSLTCLGDPLVKSLRVTIRESLGVWIYIGALPALSLCPKKTQDNLKQRHIISTVRSKHSSCGPGSSNDYASIMVQMFILFTSECTVHSR